jgi:hypothetical protein
MGESRSSRRSCSSGLPEPDAKSRTLGADKDYDTRKLVEEDFGWGSQWGCSGSCGIADWSTSSAPALSISYRAVAFLSSLLVPLGPP